MAMLSGLMLTLLWKHRMSKQKIQFYVAHYVILLGKGLVPHRLVVQMALSTKVYSGHLCIQFDTELKDSGNPPKVIPSLAKLSIDCKWDLPSFTSFRMRLDVETRQ